MISGSGSRLSARGGNSDTRNLSLQRRDWIERWDREILIRNREIANGTFDRSVPAPTVPVTTTSLSRLMSCFNAKVYGLRSGRELDCRSPG
jgi:hypothetical protein